SKDTGQWHIFADFDYTGSVSNGTLYGPTINPRMVPGTYDVYYCHNCGFDGSSVPVSGETDTNDAFPNGLRILQSNVVVGAGSANLAIDIPVSQTTGTITLGGKALPTNDEYGSSSTIYLVSKDTGQWHIFADFDYTGSVSNGTLYGPTVNPRMVPGTYDVYYCHNCELSTTSTNVTGETDTNDVFPNGLRILQSNVVVASGSSQLTIDIPVTQTTGTITLGGKALPTNDEYGSSSTIYL